MPKEIRMRVNDWFGLHSGYQLTLRPGYTVLVGPNGAGKTTLLHQIAEEAKKRGFEIFKYSNLKDGGHAAMDSSLFNGRMADLALAACSSEGQNLTYNFGNALPKLGKAVADAAKSGKTLVVLLDSLDSGSSLDRIQEIRELFVTVCEDAAEIAGRPNDFVYLINAANSFAMARGADCVDVRTGRHALFQSYDAYELFVLNYFDEHPEPAKKGVPNSDN